MKHRLKSKISIICAVCLLFCIAVGFAGAYAVNETEYDEPDFDAAEIPLYINGIKVADGVKVFDTTYVSLRAFVEFVGEQTDIAWDEETSTVTVTCEGLELNATSGSTYLSANGRCFYIPYGILNINGSISVPVREIAKVFSVDIEWDEENSSVSICADEPSIIEGGDDFYNLDDLYWLARLINAESGNQPMDGKIAVGNVVINRVEDPSCPDSIYSVIFDKRYGVQFSVTETGGIYAEPNDESLIAAKICLEGYNIVDECIYFVNPEIGAYSWFMQNRVYVATIGEHDFYA
ncbi:MAG: copper amine oxidase [Clostridiales bacterium]|nr:copper amine oxidase [Clostridiales bacterium]